MTGQYDTTERALQYDNEVVQHDNYIAFEENSSATGFIFYPGAKVDAYAYSYLTDVNANVYIAEFPFEIAFLDMDVADEIIAANPQIENWYIGAHSLGGVAANEYAKGHSEIKGVVYLASYPAEDMSSSTTKSLAFFGTNDGLVTDASEKQNFYLKVVKLFILKVVIIVKWVIMDTKTKIFKQLSKLKNNIVSLLIQLMNLLNIDSYLLDKDNYQ